MRTLVATQNTEIQTGQAITMKRVKKVKIPVSVEPEIKKLLEEAREEENIDLSHIGRWGFLYFLAETGKLTLDEVKGYLDCSKRYVPKKKLTFEEKKILINRIRGR